MLEGEDIVGNEAITLVRSSTRAGSPVIVMFTAPNSHNQKDLAVDHAGQRVPGGALSGHRANVAPSGGVGKRREKPDVDHLPRDRGFASLPRSGSQRPVRPPQRPPKNWLPALSSGSETLDVFLAFLEASGPAPGVETVGTLGTQDARGLPTLSSIRAPGRARPPGSLPSSFFSSSVKEKDFASLASLECFSLMYTASFWDTELKSCVPLASRRPVPPENRRFSHVRSWLHSAAGGGDIDLVCPGGRASRVLLIRRSRGGFGRSSRR